MSDNLELVIDLYYIETHLNLGDYLSPYSPYQRRETSAVRWQILPHLAGEAPVFRTIDWSFPYNYKCLLNRYESTLYYAYSLKAQ